MYKALKTLCATALLVAASTLATAEQAAHSPQTLKQIQTINYAWYATATSRTL